MPLRYPNMPSPYATPAPTPFRAAFAFRMLPINLLRNSLYPRQKVAFDAAIAEYQQYMGGEHKPLLLPGAMAMQQNKTDGDGRRVNWLQTTTGLTQVLNNYRHGVPTRMARVVAQPLVYNANQAASHYRGQHGFPPEGGPAVARGAWQDKWTGRFEGRTQPPPSAFAKQLEIDRELRHEQRGERYATAMGEVARAIGHDRAMLERRRGR